MGGWDLLGIGGLVVACLALGLAGGWIVDGWAHTFPAFALAGLAVGLALGIGVTWIRIRRFLE